MQFLNTTLKVLVNTALVLSAAITGVVQAQTVPRFDHVVIVLMENENFEQIIGNSSAPYINSLATSGALFTDSHGVTHPSQPNYLALFSGSTQSITDDSCPHTFTGKPNLGRQLIDAGLSFAGYSEDMPSTGYMGCSIANYARKHNPWSNFDNVPTASNQVFTSLPGNFASLPTVSFVIPNLCNDDHDCTTATGDAWLRNRLDAYVQWAKSNNSLLILTWDEDDFRTQNLIPTIFVGANVRPGNYSGSINHYNVLRTIESMYGLPGIGNATSAAAITNVWTTSTGPTMLSKNVAVSVTAATNAQLSYTFPVPTNAADLSFKLSGGTGNGDLYVQLNTAPTTSAYLAKSDTSTNTENISLATPTPGTYYVLMNAAAAVNGASLVANYSSMPNNVLTSGVPVTGINLAAKANKLYMINVPAGKTRLTFKLSGGTGDADIYAKFGTAPTTSSYDLKSDGGTNTETITINSPKAGTYYVMVYGYKAVTGTSLTGTVQ